MPTLITGDRTTSSRPYNKHGKNFKSSEAWRQTKMSGRKRRLQRERTLQSDLELNGGQ
jgi:hypothetical protein